MSRETKGYVGLGIAGEGSLEQQQVSAGMSVDGRRNRARPRARPVSGFYRGVAAVFLLVCSLLVTAQAAETVTYYYTDPLGTVLATAGANGNVLQQTDYRPYGMPVLGALSEGPGYTGQVMDVDTELVYMQRFCGSPVEGKTRTKARQSAGRTGTSSNTEMG